MTPADRTDVIDECNYTIKVLEEYAPKMMDEAEIETVIKEVLAELEIAEPTAKDKGKIMKVLMPKVKGKADGKLVNQVHGCHWRVPRRRRQRLRSPKNSLPDVRPDTYRFT